MPPWIAEAAIGLVAVQKVTLVAGRLARQQWSVDVGDDVAARGMWMIHSSRGMAGVPVGVTGSAT